MVPTDHTRSSTQTWGLGSWPGPSAESRTRVPDSRAVHVAPSNSDVNHKDVLSAHCPERDGRDTATRVASVEGAVICIAQRGALPGVLS